jgi:2-polyprenyl-3-methyl-5-hydroxy-6-metoxy-1,4-benzoquinol methylase
MPARGPAMCCRGWVDPLRCAAMATDLAGRQDEVPERFVPDEMREQLTEAEHIGRYSWAMALASGRRVLDAGCGTAYGSAMLAAGAATSVVGVDRAESVLASVRGDMPDNVELATADLRELPFNDDSFDLVVCFEVIEHIAEPGAVLDELTRVLEPNGILLVSSPNRGIYPPGNAHHLHEFTPSELESELRARLANVTLMRQHAYLTAAVLSEEQFAADAALGGIELTNLVTPGRDQEIYTLAAASDAELPPLPSLAMLTTPLAMREWVDHVSGYEETIRAQRRYIAEQGTVVADYHQMAASLREAEQRYDEARRSISRLEAERAERERDHAAQIEGLVKSFSWRVTKPIRDAKGRIGARRR